MNAVRFLKAELRKKILDERRAIPVDEWLSKSDKICEQFLNWDLYKNADLVHCYVSINERKEVNTLPLLRKMLKDGKKTATSITRFEELQLEHSLIESPDDLVPNKWGIPEPKTIIPVEIKELDVIIIPMAAADRKGNRLGYGKGFYDRFLAKTRAVKVGFIFSDFVLDEIPAESFDIRMDYLVTEKDILAVQQ